MVEVGTVDTWDRTIPISKGKTRALSDQDGILGELMGSGRGKRGDGGFPGLPGFPGSPADCPMQ